MTGVQTCALPIFDQSVLVGPRCLLLVVRCFSGVVNREAAVVSRECYCELCAVSCEI